MSQMIPLSETWSKPRILNYQPYATESKVNQFVVSLTISDAKGCSLQLLHTPHLVEKVTQIQELILRSSALYVFKTPLSTALTLNSFNHHTLPTLYISQYFNGQIVYLNQIHKPCISNVLQLLLLHQLALFQLFLSNKDALCQSKIECLRCNQLSRHSLLLDLLGSHVERVVILEDSNVAVDLALFVKIAKAYVNFGTEFLRGLLSVRLVILTLVSNFSKYFADPHSKLAEVSLILAGEPELLGLGACPELLNSGPPLLTLVRWLCQILLGLVVSIALRSLNTIVEISLPIV
ncbi:hypothetical protein FGO68_gene5417 [Halteria grandinella]|uniref:Uncharacterized protein n=1 Tax=Halteria grandinella TaxID=5974 RepID=A0A8J8T896_HALGN|nr:hypothetical protein FGO68_gene5417 [Halteria grandinella]